MRGFKTACISLAILAGVCVVVSARGAAGTGWHVTPVRSLGTRIGSAQATAVNRFGTSLVVFASSSSLTVARRTAHASKFKISGRISAHAPSGCPSCLWDLAALADGRFLLVYRTGKRLMASGLDRAGHFRARPHVLATGLSSTTTPDTLPLVAVDSDASRAVVVWGVSNNLGTNVRVEGAIDDQEGWSGSKILYSASSSPKGPFIVQLVSDSQDRFLVSLHGTNGDTTAVMWGLSGRSQQWEQVTPPQAKDGSPLASYNGATLASVNGTITAAWQDASAALVVSTWDGSTWTMPVTAIAASYRNGYPVAIYPVFVSDGSRAALIWSDGSQGLNGPVKATIRTSSSGSWSAPLVFPHSHGSSWPPGLGTIDTFWFTGSGGMAGIWTGNPVKRFTTGLYVGRVGARGASSTVLSRTETPNNGRGWFALRRGAGLTTIVWANKKGREFSATATRNGDLRQKHRLPACGYPGPAASNVEASPQVVAVTPNGPVGGNGTRCPSLLLW